MAEGFVLSITPTMLKRLDEADAKISKLQTTSDKTSAKIIDDFRRMAAGVDPFMEKIKNVNNLLSKLSAPNISIKGFKETAADGEKAAKATASITESLNKIKSNPIDDINKKIASLKDLLNQATRSVEEYSRKMASVKSTGSGMISGTVVKEGGAGAALIPQIQAQIAALEQEKKSISSSQVLWQQRLDSLNNSSLATQRQVSDLAKLNESFRTGQSEMQKQAKVVDSTADSISKMIIALDKAATSQNKLNDSEKNKNQKKSDTAAERALEKYNNALNKSEVTIANRARKIEALANAERALTKTGRDYTLELAKIRTETERLNKANVDAANSVSKVKSNQRSLIDTSGQLERKLALLFSISQIEGYVMKMVNIRGEFELQNVALRAILQNKDEADRLFGQITELAVRSPFRVKELVTYTKELAAYRVESSKLYDTTKMLADVSAGLGVDMSRLILAFGQVKAANYLRGTELRQFSEAGINILGELATYYSELEGRMISVGDVQERVTKRMVAFGDVEEIFKRITSAGGIFYNMQEIQAETLAGQMSNLGDSIDIMFNTIGKANEGTLKGSVASIRELVENWREVAFVLKDLIITFGVYKGVTSLAALGNSAFAGSLFKAHQNILIYSKSLVLANANTTRANIITNLFSTTLTRLKPVLLSFAKGLGALAMTAAPVLLIAGIFELYRRMTQASRQAAELKKNLDGIVSEDVSSLDKSIKGYETLTARLSKANEGSKERRDIIASIKNQYGEYLDFIVDENTTVKQLSDSYEILIKRMKERAGAASLQKGYAEIEQSYQNNIRDARKELEDELKEGIRIEGLYYLPTGQEIQDIYNIVQTQVSKLDSELIDSSTEQRNLLSQIIEEYYGAGATISQDYLQLVDVMSLMVQKKEKEKELEKDINFQYKETLKTREGNIALWELQNKLALDRRKIENTAGLSDFDVKEQLKAIQEQFELDKIELKFKFGEISEAEMNIQKDKIINWATTTVASINEKLSQSLISAGISKEDISKVLIDKTLQDAGMSAVIKETTQGYETQQGIIKQELALKSAGLDYDEKLLANAQLMSKLYEARGKVLGLELDTIVEINEATADSINSMLPPEYWITILDKQKSIATLIKETNADYEQAKTLVETLNNEKALGVIIDEKQLENAERDLKYLNERRKLLGFKEKTTGGDKENTIYKDRISLIKEMNSQYEKLLQNYSKEDAANKVRASYKDTFAELFKGTEMEGTIATMDFDVSGAIAALEQLLKTATGKARLEAQKALDGLRARVNLDVVVERTDEVKSELEDLFSGYELSLELEKLNIPPELAKQLFNVDVFNLDELQKKATPYLAELRAQGGNQIKVADDIEKKISDMNEKALIDRMKTYSKYLLKSTSESAKIKINELRQIQEIEKTFTKPEQQEEKKIVIEKVREESKKKLQKQEWSDFKGTDMYTTMFEDLEFMGTKAITRLRENLEQLKGSLSELPAEQVKDIMTQISKLEEQEIKRNPFDALRKSMEDVKALQKEGRTEEYIAEELAVSEAQIASANAQIDAIDTIITARRENLSLEEQGSEWMAENTQLLKMTNDELDIQRNILSENAEQNQNIANTAILDLGKYSKARKSLEAMGNEWSQLQSLATSAYASIKDILSSMGVDSESSAMMLADMGMSLLDLVGQAVMFGLQMQLLTVQAELLGIAINSMLGPIGWIVIGLQAVATLFTGIFGISDKKKERQIQRELQLIDKLQKSYEKLEKAIDNAYSLDTLQSANKAAKANLQEQIAATERAIAAEEAKKASKRDDDKIREWRDNIDKMQEQLKELETGRLEALGGFGTEANYKSAAEEFANAWYDAYKETGDGLTGLEDTFDSFIDNMVKKQLLLRGTQQLLDPLLKMVDGVVSDGIVDLKEMEKIENQWQDQTKPALDALYKMLADQMGIMGGQADAELSGLQRGIQAITEPTAQALESLLNSMRFFVSDSNTQIKNIYALFANADAPNPILSELKAQTMLVRSIYDLFNGMTAPHVKSGGRGMKVVLD